MINVRSQMTNQCCIRQQKKVVHVRWSTNSPRSNQYKEIIEAEGTQKDESVRIILQRRRLDCCWTRASEDNLPTILFPNTYLTQFWIELELKLSTSIMWVRIEDDVAHHVPVSFPFENKYFDNQVTES